MTQEKLWLHFVTILAQSHTELDASSIGDLADTFLSAYRERFGKSITNADVLAKLLADGDAMGEYIVPTRFEQGGVVHKDERGVDISGEPEFVKSTIDPKHTNAIKALLDSRNNDEQAPETPSEQTDPYTYPWHEAPDWAMWAATNQSGIAYWHGEPFVSNQEFVAKFKFIGYDFPIENWRNSLRKRPGIQSVEHPPETSSDQTDIYKAIDDALQSVQ